LVVLWLGLAGCNTADPALFPPSIAAPEASPRVVWVTTNHWHTGLILADADLSNELRATLQPWFAALRARGLPLPAYHEFGWGDDAYYRAPANAKATGEAAAALLWPTKSVAHLFALDADPEAVYADGRFSLFRVELSPAGHAALSRFLHDRLAVPTEVVQVGVAGPSSAFVTANARRRYHLLHNCNHMVADALRAAGLPISPIYAVHSVNIDYQLARIADQYDAVTRLQTRRTD
jgi:hypothetical protein